jgi:hypothetical protein
VHWLEPSVDGWPVPVLDVQPVAAHLQAWTLSRQVAANAMSYDRDDGLGFASQAVPDPRVIPLSLRYRVEPLLADGVVFAPGMMEHKWVVFHHDSTLLFVRSWQRRTLVRAKTRQANGWVELVEANGTFTGPDEEPAFTRAAIEFIVRTHALRTEYPAPLLGDPGSDLEEAARWCFAIFGNFAKTATYHRFASDPPERPLRSHSLLHLAVVSGDLARAQAQLDAGIPVDLRDADGVPALQWAAVTGDTTVAQWLLERGLHVDARDEQGVTALMLATQHDDQATMRLLLDHGADVDAADNRGFTSLHRAAEAGLVGAARQLLERGAASDPVAQGQTPLSLAQAHNQDGVIALLQSH